MGHASGTENPLKDANPRTYKSLAFEKLVEHDFCVRGYSLLCKRQKIKYCEIDLIFYNSAGEIIFVEVKGGHTERVLERWQKSQQVLRQRRVVQHCLERGFKVLWMLSVVDQAKIQHWNLLDMV